MVHFINPQLGNLRVWLGMVGEAFDGGWADVPGNKLPVHYNEFSLLASKYTVAAIIATEKDFDLYSIHGRLFLVPICDLLEVAPGLSL